MKPNNRIRAYDIEQENVALRVELGAFIDREARHIAELTELRERVMNQAEYACSQDDRLEFQQRQIESMMARPRLETAVPEWVKWAACVVMMAVVVGLGRWITN